MIPRQLWREDRPGVYGAKCLTIMVTGESRLASKMVLPEGRGEVTRESIREYAAAVRPRYAGASRAEQGLILDEFCQTTGYHRKSVVRLLGQRKAEPIERRGRPRTYGPEIRAVVTQLWEASDRLCSKRLVGFLPELVTILERHGELVLTEAVREQVGHLSAATVDRVLKPLRARTRRHPLTQTVATATLKAQIPVRTFGDWHGVRPGAVQADLVAHCGDSSEGFYLTTLDVVDVATGWTDCRILWGKGQDKVGGALHQVKTTLPFPLRELHTDNGAEFLNRVVYPWCQKNAIALTRGRPYRKNDQAFVEQKNWSVVRRLVGYDRYSTKAASLAFERLYRLIRSWVNFFQPLRKVVSKERVGAKVLKRYDVAQTPYQRVLALDVLTDAQAAALRTEFLRLNPVRLRAAIEVALDALWNHADRRDAPERLRTSPGTEPPPLPAPSDSSHEEIAS